MLFIVTGCFYYSLFYNYGYNIADEGYVALIAEKIFYGEIPFKDIEIGYNIMWYYPISWLFALTGVNFNLIKIYFLTIALASSLFSYALLLRLTSNKLLGLLAGISVLFFPGTIHKTYIPFLIISGLYTLFLYDFKTSLLSRKNFIALLIQGIYLALAHLIRPDIGNIYTLIFFFYHTGGASFLYLQQQKLTIFLVLLSNITLIFTVFILSTLPFIWHARAHNYYDRFIVKYYINLDYLVSSVNPIILPGTGVNQVKPNDELNSGHTQQKDNFTTAEAGTLLQRAQIYSFFDHDADKTFIFLTYCPVFIFAFVLLYLITKCIKAGIILRRAPAEFISDYLCLTAILIGALSSFPQFFFFRPDFAHLSQFMPGFIIFNLYFLYILISEKQPKHRFRIWCNLSFFFIILFTLYISVYAFSYKSSLSLRTERNYNFQPGKGINVYLNSSEFKGLNELYIKIREVVDPKEYLLCFPYSPGINFMTDRPTFQKKLYVDDSILITQPHWLEEMQQEIEEKKPKMIMISDWAINGTEISRFRNWARPLYTYITKQYSNTGEIMGFQLFVRE